MLKLKLVMAEKKHKLYNSKQNRTIITHLLNALSKPSLQGGGVLGSCLVVFSFGDVGGDFGQGDHFYKQIPYTSYLRLILDIECEKLI